MLEYFYITNSPDVAEKAQEAGVNRIFVDMEYIGKAERQGGLDTVQNHHTVEDVKNLRSVLDESELLVRVNPIHDNSENEINDVIDAGADVIMLPMWKSVKEVETFYSIVNKRVKTILLLETDEARLCLDDVLKLNSVDEIYIGLNDLHLSQKKDFMFELLVDGTVDEIVSKLKSANIKFGIGGVGKVNCNNLLPAENILAEHYRLGSSMVILARAFCDWTSLSLDEFESEIRNGVKENREYESLLSSKPASFFSEKHKQTKEIIEKIIKIKKS
ncbi:MAG: aldolase [Eubacterium sp.]|nr:aldolase [Eubacterium sp.]